MKRPWVFNDHLPLIPDAGLKIVFFCTLSRHKHHFVHNFQDLTTVLLYIIFKILPSPQSFCTNISKFCHKHMYTVQCALCMSYLAQDGTMKKKEHQNIYFNQTQGSIFHFNMMSLVPTSIWNFITWNIYWEKKTRNPNLLLVITLLLSQTGILTLGNERKKSKPIAWHHFTCNLSKHIACHHSVQGL